MVGVEALGRGFLLLSLSTASTLAGFAAGVAGAVPAAAAFFTAAVVLALAALALYLRRGFAELKAVDSGFALSHLGVKLMLYSLAAIGASIAISGAYQGDPPTLSRDLNTPRGAAGLAALALLLASLPLGLAGYALVFILGALRLYDRFKDRRMLAAGLLYAADIAALAIKAGGALTLAGHLIMYLALRRRKP
ncbi:hypothetical protein [Pyrobaculum neutrophilum]|uniref:Uncharacterized protein n=1 Tax=Pyrobaculum neutrophilum (strain DSM 2338 / JCM 9278 / NBRC 100436 / V24Sta) TaxID=444157 RepID=B1YDT7_PYRNV|nr:hypothetical protein [Pyrobaculum neutrophilum]ACB39950.1 hypothetical protein Tneu_1018 [Pyrobaculum neutrophilum V24Sta]